MESPLEDLFVRIQQSSEYSPLSHDVLEIFFTVPTLVLEREPKMDEEELNQIINMVTKAIKK